MLLSEQPPPGVEARPERLLVCGPRPALRRARALLHAWEASGADGRADDTPPLRAETARAEAGAATVTLVRNT